MATYTENYNLIKPGAEDYYDVEDFNSNMDTLDGVMAAAENELTGISNKMDTAQNGIDGIASAIGTPPAEGETLFSQLAKGGSVIRSIQYITYTATSETSGGGDVPIQSVNPAKAFVISERLMNGYDNLVSYEYTLNSSYIKVSHSSSAVNKFKVGFWVVEFV